MGRHKVKHRMYNALRRRQHKYFNLPSSLLCALIKFNSCYTCSLYSHLFRPVGSACYPYIVSSAFISFTFSPLVARLSRDSSTFSFPLVYMYDYGYPHIKGLDINCSRPPSDRPTWYLRLTRQACHRHAYM
ncbi:hypothetical protein QBC45DRAFT_158350 [Copromyces sp. CBS 386.78]|nr:hypothetical protein QBC45DRAFT_158350 [Copromyces sp. CBS 386.78]